MSRYRMEDGSIIDTDKAIESWDEGTRWDGRNHISLATGDQWLHQTLYRSRKGRWYIEHVSAWQGSRPHVEYVSPEEAARWLLTNEHDPASEDFPVDLKQYVDELVE